MTAGAYWYAVIAIHVYGRRTAGVVVCRVGAGVGAERVTHDEVHKEAVDDLSLITLPRAIAAVLST